MYFAARAGYENSEKYDDINVLSAGMPAAIVTPDGVWHEYYEENNMASFFNSFRVSLMTECNG